MKKIGMFELDTLGIFPYEREDEKTFIERGNQFLLDALELKEKLKKRENLEKVVSECFPELVVLPDTSKRKILDNFKVRGIEEFPSSLGFLVARYALSPIWTSVIEYPCSLFDYYPKRRKILGSVKKYRRIPIVFISSSEIQEHIALHELIHAVRIDLGNKIQYEESFVTLFSRDSLKAAQDSAEFYVQYFKENYKFRSYDSLALILGSLAFSVLVGQGFYNLLSSQPSGTIKGALFLSMASLYGYTLFSRFHDWYINTNMQQINKRLENLYKMLNEEKLDPVLIRLTTKELVEITKKLQKPNTIKRWLEKDKKNLRKRSILEKFF